MHHMPYDSQSAVHSFGSSCFDIKLLGTHNLGNRQTLHEHMVAMGDQMMKLEMSGLVITLQDNYAFMPV